MVGGVEEHMRLVFMGTPAYAAPVLAALCQMPGVEVAGVYTPPDRPRGRGREVEATPIKVAAQELGLAVFQPASLRPARVQQELAGLAPDVIVVAAYGKLLPAEVLDLPRHGCLNIHPSLLPQYRGPSPVVTAILDGLRATGVSLMLLDEGMDTGPVVAQREYSLAGTETAGMLTEELFNLGAGLLVENLEPWTSHQLGATPQDESRASVTRKLERADGAADWSLTAKDLERRRRAFTPWPGLFTQWKGKSLRLLDVVDIEGSAEPGEVVAISAADAPVGIGTARGILGLKTLQLEGRRALAADDFLRGFSDFVGSRL